MTLLAACPDSITNPSYTLTVEPPAVTLTAGDSTRFTAALRDGDGNAVDAVFTWRTGDPEVATVSRSGLVRAVAAGATSLRVSARETSAIASVTVLESGQRTLTIVPAGARLFPDQTVRFTAVLLDRDGDTLPATPQWSTDNAAVATVDQSGLARAIAPGSATIGARVNTLSAAAALTVAERPGTAALVGAGDIASCDASGDERTADLLDEIAGTVFTAGDHAYPDGTVEQFRQCYDPSWGRHKDRTRPAPGNHDYHTFGAAGYYGYFGAAAGAPDQGYYSYDLGGWHVIALNSNLRMNAGSPQEQWLRQDLATNPAPCTLAYWHDPRFSSGLHGSSGISQGAWDALYAAGADVIIAAHDHTYERFAPQDPEGRLDLERGIRQFVVGTGGAGLYEFRGVAANSEVRNNESHGVLRLTLHPDRYEWEFVPVGGGGFTDAGSASCR
ncbi:MAG: Ig-like domain-containing protein [Gemmatimonadales bacterium]